MRVFKGPEGWEMRLFVDTPVVCTAIILCGGTEVARRDYALGVEYVFDVGSTPPTAYYTDAQPAVDAAFRAIVEAERRAQDEASTQRKARIMDAIARYPVT